MYRATDMSALKQFLVQPINKDAPKDSYGSIPTATHYTTSRQNVAASSQSLAQLMPVRSASRGTVGPYSSENHLSVPNRNSAHSLRSINKHTPDLSDVFVEGRHMGQPLHKDYSTSSNKTKHLVLHLNPAFNRTKNSQQILPRDSLIAIQKDMSTGIGTQSRVLQS